MNYGPPFYRKTRRVVGKIVFTASGYGTHEDERRAAEDTRRTEEKRAKEGSVLDDRMLLRPCTDFAKPQRQCALIFSDSSLILDKLGGICGANAEQTLRHGGHGISASVVRFCVAVVAS